MRGAVPTPPTPCHVVSNDNVTFFIYQHFSSVNTGYWLSVAFRHICRFTCLLRCYFPQLHHSATSFSLIHFGSSSSFSFFFLHQVTIRLGHLLTSHAQYMSLPFTLLIFHPFQNCWCYSHFYLIISFPTFKLHLFRGCTITLKTHHFR